MFRICLFGQNDTEVYGISSEQVIGCPLANRMVPLPSYHRFRELSSGSLKWSSNSFVSSSVLIELSSVSMGLPSVAV